MKRHPALEDLSRDHFHVLFRCQRFRKLLQDPSAKLVPLVKEFVAFFDSDMSPHFTEEDELVLPLAEKIDSLANIARRTREEHKRLRDLIGGLRSVTTDRAARVALLRLEPMITEHVHMEEANLFEGVQAHLSAETLEDLRQRSLAFRTKHRAPDAIGPRKGRG